MPKQTTSTSSFGAGKREAHDASRFYERNLYDGYLKAPAPAEDFQHIEVPPPGDWADKIYHHTAENMAAVPDNSVAVAFTSPPYNVGKDYDDDLGLDDYLSLIGNVGREVYRVLRPGGRYAINIANLGRKPYIPMHALFYTVHLELGFLPMGEIIWQKGRGASGSCAWGSWMSAKAPRLHDLHEYILIFAKQSFSRPDSGKSDIGREEFMAATLSVWEIPPKSAKKVGHPAPFPVELARRIIRLYSYEDEVILDPFAGSGTTCLAASNHNRHYVGFDTNQEYVEIARRRLAETAQV